MDQDTYSPYKHYQDNDDNDLVRGDPCANTGPQSGTSSRKGSLGRPSAGGSMREDSIHSTIGSRRYKELTGKLSQKAKCLFRGYKFNH